MPLPPVQGCPRDGCTSGSRLQHDGCLRRRQRRLRRDARGRGESARDAGAAAVVAPRGRPLQATRELARPPRGVGVPAPSSRRSSRSEPLRSSGIVRGAAAPGARMVRVGPSSAAASVFEGGSRPRRGVPRGYSEGPDRRAKLRFSSREAPVLVADRGAAAPRPPAGRGSRRGAAAATGWIIRRALAVAPRLPRRYSEGRSRRRRERARRGTVAAAPRTGSVQVRRRQALQVPSRGGPEPLQ